MSWKPNIQNVSQPIPTKNILRKASTILDRHHLTGFAKEQLKDEHGIYGLHFGHFILLAKDYVYGNIISVHKIAVATAIQHEIKLLVYLADADSFYSFKAEDILKNSEENRKGRAVMLNFHIRLGTKFELPVTNIKGYA